MEEKLYHSIRINRKKLIYANLFTQKEKLEVQSYFQRFSSWCDSMALSSAA